MSTLNTVGKQMGAAMGMAGAQTQGIMGETQDRFLTLLVTQLRNQDPLNPLDNAQVTSQIAQMSTVNGINQLNNTLLALTGQMDVSQSMQAAALIGKEVLVPGGKVLLGSGEAGKTATPFGLDLHRGATETVVSILDSSGKAVRTFNLGAKESGVYSLDWDGLDDQSQALSDGSYTVKVTATNDGQPVTAEPLSYGKVSSVAYTAAGLKLDLGLAGSHSLLDIRKIM